MKAVSVEDIDWKQYPGQRAITIRYRGLLKGEHGRPDNYELALNHFEDEQGSFSPRHRHNFEQFRYAFDTPLNYAPNKDIPPGQIGYFPEGAYYGPQTIAHEAYMLIVQFGGASGSGYLGWDELMRATNELKEKGSFEKGVFTWTEDGKRFNKDGYEAVWEHANKKKIEYCKPRYREPIVIDPEAFSWIPAEGHPGVAVREFGVFGERRAATSQIRLKSGSHYTLTTNSGPLLVYVLTGALEYENRSYPEGSAMEVVKGDHAKVSATGDTLLLTFTMPDFNAVNEASRQREAVYA